MRCLCCNKIIPDSASPEEKSWQWHRKCVHRFFGTDTLPEIDLSEDSLKKLVDHAVAEGLTIPGVQKKMSLHLTAGSHARLTLVNYPTGYILKPQTNEYANLPEYEHMAMQMAELVRIPTVPHALIGIHGHYAYITKRVDRFIQGDSVKMFAMEDFCQLSGRLTRDKYRASYENCGKIIKRYSSYPGLDLSEMFLRVLFSYLIGNSDMHLKNFSLREETPSSRVFHLSEAYDMLSVNLILPTDKDETALTVNGKKRNLQKKDFLKLAANCEIPDKASIKIISNFLKEKERLISCCRESYLSKEQQDDVIRLIETRAKVLSQ